MVLSIALPPPPHTAAVGDECSQQGSSREGHQKMVMEIPTIVLALRPAVPESGLVVAITGSETEPVVKDYESVGYV